MPFRREADVEFGAERHGPQPRARPQLAAQNAVAQRRRDRLGQTGRLAGPAVAPSRHPAVYALRA
jgi:hypothetical protein